MSIYKRQMEKLGLNLEQYSKLVGMPIEITKKLINGKEVVENIHKIKPYKPQLFHLRGMD